MSCAHLVTSSDAIDDPGGEELEEAAGGLVAGGCDHARRQNAVAGGDRERFRLLNDDLLLHAGLCKITSLCCSKFLPMLSWLGGLHGLY